MERDVFLKKRFFGFIESGVRMNSLTKGLFICVLAARLLSSGDELSADETGPILDEVQQLLKDRAQEAEKIEAQREEAAKARREALGVCPSKN